MSSDIDARLAKLKEDWFEIEGAVKQAEFIRELTLIPPINQLRYAGRHLAELVSLLSSKESDAVLIGVQIDRASQELDTARSDVIDAVFYQVESDINRVRQRFPEDIILINVPQFNQLLRDVEAGVELIIQSRRDFTSRATYHKKILDGLYERILLGYRDLLAKEDSDIILQSELERDKGFFKEGINWFIAVWGLVIGVIGGALSYATDPVKWFLNSTLLLWIAVIIISFHFLIFDRMYWIGIKAGRLFVALEIVSLVALMLFFADEMLLGGQVRALIFDGVYSYALPKKR
jgi:hypothetical protein